MLAPHRAMPMPFFFARPSFVCSLLCVAAVSSSPGSGVFFSTSARAIAPPPMEFPNYVYFETTVFASGSVIVGRLVCNDQLCAPEQLVFTDELGSPLNGQLVDVSTTLGGDYFGWLADSPAAPGVYSVSLSSGDLSGSPFVEIVEASEELPMVAVELATRSTIQGEPVNCQVLAATALETGFYEQALYEVYAAGTVSGTNVSQYIYDLRLSGDEANRFSGTWSLAAFLEGEPDEVCFEVFARPITGGDDISLTAGCLSTEAFTLGVVDELSANTEHALKTCAVPPDGYFEEWCAAFAEQFAAESCEGTHQDACFAARQDCLDGDHPTDEEIQEEIDATGGTGGLGTGGLNGGGEEGGGTGAADGSGAVDGTGARGPDNDGQSAGSEGDGASASEHGSCTVGVPRGSRGGAWWMLLGLAACALGRRGASKSRVAPSCR